MVTAQIDRLAPGDRHVLRYASVLGASFSQTLLSTIVESDRTPDERTWRRLGEFLVNDAPGRWRFRHALMRDAAYEGLPYRRRRELHARAGQAILADADQPEDVAEVLSLHFFNAQRHDESWVYSKQAGDRAQKKFANTEAATFYTRAVESGKRVGVALAELAAVYESLGDVKWLVGAYGEADSAFASARRLFAGDPAGQAAMWHKEAQTPYQLGRFSQSIRRIRRGLAVIEGIDDHAASKQRAQLIALYAGIRAAQARYAESEQWCTWLIEHTPAMGDDPLIRDALGRAYYILDLCYVEQGKVAEATNWPMALAIYEELGQLGSQADVLVAAGGYAYYRGDWDEALEHWERARQLRTQIGDAVEAAWGTNNIGEIRSDQGRLEEAEHLFKEASRVHRAADQAEGRAYAASNLGRVASRSGRPDDALPLFEEARTIFEEMGNRPQVLETSARIAECELLRGDLEHALTLADLALERALALGGVAVQSPMLHRIRGCALLRSGRPTEARAALDESLRDARSRAARFEVALTLEAFAELDRVEGCSPDVPRAEEAAEILRQLGVVLSPRIL
jgi:tetratricopeptide (TPR) repeat protein